VGADIFISFASQDRRVAMTLCTALESRGIKCWISSRDIPPGENFQIAIVRAIRNAKIMLLVFTANSNNSDEMNKELALASQNKLMVVPLRIEDVAPNDAFAYEFATRQWIDFFADWELAIQQLADRIGHATGAAAGTGPAAPAVEVEAEVEAEPVAEATAVEAAPEHEPEPEPAAAPEAAAPIAAAPESRSFRKAPDLSADDASEPATELTADETPAPSRRLAIYAALSVILVLIVGAGLAAPSLRRAKAQHPDARAMVVLPSPSPAASPATPAAASTVAVADPALPPDDAVVKPVKHKKAAQAKTEDSEVPY
jgi:hypothetical protein